MSKKVLGLALVTLGVAVMLLALGADALGIGNGVGIGWKQATGAVLGLAILLAGVWLLLKAPKIVK